MNILQIAGGQAWPNFLPLLAFRPAKVWFLTSADPDGRFRKSIGMLMEAAGEAGINSACECLPAQGGNPTLAECQAALANLESSEIHLVNLTGGTKAMSFAAWRFARDRGIPSFHLDTRRAQQPFDDFGTGPMPTRIPDIFRLAADRVTVRIALLAQGFPAPQKFKKPLDHHIAFARESAHLRTDECQGKEIAEGVAQMRACFSDDNGRFLRKGKLREALLEPTMAQSGSAFHRYLTAAVDHGIIASAGDSGGFHLVSGEVRDGSASQLESKARNAFKLLEGIWFELAVLAHLRTLRSFSDIGWSIEAEPIPSGASRGETDLVAFNHETLNLHFISCKTMGPESTPLDHIQGLRRRATKEGGEFAKAELWVFRPKSAKHRQDLENHCSEQNVMFRVFTDHSSLP